MPLILGQVLAVQAEVTTPWPLPAGPRLLLGRAAAGPAHRADVCLLHRLLVLRLRLHWSRGLLLHHLGAGDGLLNVGNRLLGRGHRGCRELGGCRTNVPEDALSTNLSKLLSGILDRLPVDDNPRRVVTGVRLESQADSCFTHWLFLSEVLVDEVGDLTEGQAAVVLVGERGQLEFLSLAEVEVRVLGAVTGFISLGLGPVRN